MTWSQPSKTEKAGNDSGANDKASTLASGKPAYYAYERTLGKDFQYRFSHNIT